MRAHQWIPVRAGKGILAAVVLAVSIALAAGANRSQAAAQAQAKMESTIFSFDGKDFVRTKTTMMTEDGKSAVNTKLDHASPAYKALMEKHSYVGEATVFGHKYDADYAPLTGADGKLSGALFVGVAK
jgi:Cache 3/Cache 2 fusion domain